MGATTEFGALLDSQNSAANTIPGLRADVAYYKRINERLTDEVVGLREQMTPPLGDEIDGYPELDCPVEHDGALMTVRYIVRARWGQPEISGIFHGCFDILKELTRTPAWAYAAAAQDILARQREAEEARADMYEVEA